MRTEAREAESAPSETRRAGPSRRSQVVLILLVTVAAVVSAVAYLAVRHERYSTTSNILVAPLSLSDPLAEGLPFIRESSDGSRPVQSAVGLLATPVVARATAQRLGSGWTQRKVSDAVVVVPRGESDIVAITATDDSASRATRLANAYARAALRVRRAALRPYVEPAISRLRMAIGGTDSAAQATIDRDTLGRLQQVITLGDPTLSIAAVALRPTSGTEKPRSLVLAVALIAGLLIGIGAAFLRSAADGARLH